jgi:hypothetical protein
MPQERVKAMMAPAREAFHNVRAMSINVGVSGWPAAANLTFRAVARQMYELYKNPWLLLEPDAVPLRASWLEELAREYALSPRPLLGSLIDNEAPTDGLPKKYLSAISVYPQNLYARLDALWKDARFNGPTKPPKVGVAQWQNGVRAWDMLAADFLVPRAQHTALIQSHWGTSYNTPPVFVTARTEADPPNAVTLAFIKPSAALFHRVKALDAFLPMWRIRMEHAKALVTEALKPTGASQYVLDKALEAGLIEAPGAPVKKKPAQKQAELATA